MKNEENTIELSSKPKVHRIPFAPQNEQKQDNRGKYISAGVAIFAILCIVLLVLYNSDSHNSKNETITDSNAPDNSDNSSSVYLHDGNATIVGQTTKITTKDEKATAEKPKNDQQNLLDIVGKY